MIPKLLIKFQAFRAALYKGHSIKMCPIESEMLHEGYGGTLLSNSKYEEVRLL